MYINGKWFSLQELTIPILNPATGRPFVKTAAVTGLSLDEYRELAREWAREKLAASSAKLVRMANSGKASPAQIAQLESKQLSSRDRLLSLLTANPKDPTKIHADVRDKFKGIGQESALGARIKNINAMGPNSGWEGLRSQLGLFHRDFRDIRKSIPQEAWASNKAIRAFRDYEKQQSRDPRSGLSKSFRANIHKQLFDSLPNDKGQRSQGLASIASGRASKIHLFPQAASNTRALDAEYTLFHEGGHTLDPLLRRQQDMHAMQKSLRGYPGLRPGPTQTYAPWKSSLEGHRPRAEAFADSYAGHMLHRHRYRQGDKSPLQIRILTEYLRQNYAQYGGGKTNTAIPKGYLYGLATKPNGDLLGFGDPLTQTRRLMNQLGIDTPVTLREFREGPGVLRGGGPVSPVFMSDEQREKRTELQRTVEPMSVW